MDLLSGGVLEGTSVAGASPDVFDGDLGDASVGVGFEGVAANRNGLAVAAGVLLLCACESPSVDLVGSNGVRKRRPEDGFLVASSTDDGSLAGSLGAVAGIGSSATWLGESDENESGEPESDEIELGANRGWTVTGFEAEWDSLSSLVVPSASFERKASVEMRAGCSATRRVATEDWPALAPRSDASPTCVVDSLGSSRGILDASMAIVSSTGKLASTGDVSTDSSGVSSSYLDKSRAAIFRVRGRPSCTNRKGCDGVVLTSESRLCDIGFVDATLLDWSPEAVRSTVESFDTGAACFASKRMVESGAIDRLHAEPSQASSLGPAGEVADPRFNGASPITNSDLELVPGPTELPFLVRSVVPVAPRTVDASDSAGLSDPGRMELGKGD